MAKIENQPKVILTKEEVDTLKKAQKILSQIGAEDYHGDIFKKCDNFDSEWFFIESVLCELVDIAEVE